MGTQTEIPDITSGWEFTGLRDSTLFFRSAGMLLPLGSMLVLEEGSMSESVRTFVEHRAVSPRWRVGAGTIWPRSRFHWLPGTPEVLDGLAALSKHNAEPEICDHLYAVSDGELIVSWHDAFDGTLLVGVSVPEARVNGFADAVGISPSPRQAA